jgi:hypothetical protein
MKSLDMDDMDVDTKVRAKAVTSPVEALLDSWMEFGTSVGTLFGSISPTVS